MSSFPKRKSHFDSVEVLPHASNYGKGHRSITGLSFEDVRDHTPPSSVTKAPETYHAAAQSHGDWAKELEDKELNEENAPKAAEKFGTFDGVLGRCLLNMWGVIMFLRTGWIVGQAGILQATLVMLVSASVTFFTTLSLCAIVTNGQVEGGGPYFFISRSLGPQWGGVVGILFAFANCVGVALHIAGFAVAVKEVYETAFNWTMTPNGNFDIQIIGFIGLLFLILVGLRGVGSIIKFNLFLLFLMFVSIIAFVIGTFTTKPEPVSLGFTGYSSQTFRTNWSSAYTPKENFLSMIAIFFPSVTGCMAGANISGDLKNPKVNIPVGTMAAVAFSILVYIILAWMLGSTCMRQSEDGTGGLYHDEIIMSNLAVWKPLVDIGIYASTFSSATSSFVAAPRILQAVFSDGLFPSLQFLGVGRASDNEPIRCYVVVLVLATAFLASGSINFIAPMVTNFFMVTYALVNYSVYEWETTKVPGWRPSFKYYHKWLCLFATVQCITLMFMIDYIIAFSTFVAGYLVFKYVEYVNPKVEWGTTNEAHIYSKTCRNVLKYQKIKQHAKVIRPSFLILNIEPKMTSNLYFLAKALNYSDGLIVIGDVIIGGFNDVKALNTYKKRCKCATKIIFDSFDAQVNDEINENCIIECIIAQQKEAGFRNILQLCGMGGFRPNVTLISIPFDGKKKRANDDDDLKPVIGNGGTNGNFTDPDDNTENVPFHKGAASADDDDDNTVALAAPKYEIKEDGKKEVDKGNKPPVWYTTMKDAISTGIGVVLTCDKKGCEIDLLNVCEAGTYIDVWWIYDDGGMTLLLAYLLTKSQQFKNCQLRVMSLETMEINDKIELISFINELRIPADVYVIGQSGNVMETVYVDKLKVQQKNRAKEDAIMALDTIDEKNVVVNDGDDENTTTTSPKASNKYGVGKLENVKSAKSILNVFDDEQNKIRELRESIDGDIKENLTKEIPDMITLNGVEFKISNFARKKIAKYLTISKLIMKQTMKNKCEVVYITMPYPRREYQWYEYHYILKLFMQNINVPVVFVRGNQDQVLITDF